MVVFPDPISPTKTIFLTVFARQKMKEEPMITGPSLNITKPARALQCAN
ncbi:hypothetical protein GGR36_002682 [Niveibacterium umoris]|uniref:Uncharacterized protein n=1 Tax=Niveibacterium umoris TaxID=1193620 RepID=A0A840BRB5_9RHOO|nr:hypothetical protein [Niveibacterium umoris]